MSLGGRLKLLREEGNITQGGLAKLLGVGRPTVAGYETKGKQPSFEILEKIADHFNVSVDYLLGRTDSRNHTTPVKDGSHHPLANEINALSDESRKELEQYIQFLKTKEEVDKSKDETSSVLERNA